MKNQRILGGILVMSVVILSGLTSCSQADAEAANKNLATIVSIEEDGATLLDDIYLKGNYEGDNELSDELSEWLKFMREEEKLARDIYTVFSKEYMVPVFKNISKAEQNHMDAVLSFLNDYGIDDPADQEAGVFNNEKLQSLYNELVEKGSAGLVEALKVGALIEEVDIIDLAEVYELEPGEDITALTEALMLGSRNHLRAFTRVLGFQDLDYVPELLSLEDYNTIIEQGWERGTGLCRNIDTKDGTQFGYGRGKGFRGGR